MDPGSGRERAGRVKLPDGTGHIELPAVSLPNKKRQPTAPGSAWRQPSSLAARLCAQQLRVSAAAQKKLIFFEAAERITADPFSEISAGFLGEFWQTLGELGQDFGRIWEDLAGFRQDVGWIWEPRA